MVHLLSGFESGCLKGATWNFTAVPFNTVPAFMPEYAVCLFLRVEFLHAVANDVFANSCVSCDRRNQAHPLSAFFAVGFVFGSRGQFRLRVRSAYFTGATSNFFSMPLVAATPLLPVEQQAKLSAPQLVHL